MEERQLIFAIREYLENYKKNSVKAATYDRLLISCKLMENYQIARMRVSNVQAIDIQRYLNQLIDDRYAINTIKKQSLLLTSYLKHAHSVGDISKPIYLSVKIPSEQAVKKPIKRIETYSDSEQRKLRVIFESLDRIAWGAAILMLETGMRVGEVLGLSWNDIDWNRRAIRIGKTLVRLSSKPETFVQYSPKSKTSARTIPLSERAIDVLERIREKTGDEGYVFPYGINPLMPMSYSSLEYHLKVGCKEAGVPYKGTHVFRHTFATNCYHRGCDVKLLSKLLGHADVAITYNIYIHLFGDALEEMRKVIG